MSNVFTRRDLLAQTVPTLAVAGLMAGVGNVFSSNALAQDNTTAGAASLSPALDGAFKDGQYVLPPLAYGYDALEPHIDQDTMKLHHDKHHKAYVEGLNKTLKGLAEVRAAGGEINVSALCGLQEDLSFNASGHFLHTIFWSTMGPNAGGEPGGDLADAITKSFGSVAAFRAHFSKAAAGVKGSGWAILAYEPVGDSLMVMQVKQHDLQTVAGVVPLLPLDVWEHAYYLKYHNVRADYVKAWWDVVNWQAVASAYGTLHRVTAKA